MLTLGVVQAEQKLLPERLRMKCNSMRQVNNPMYRTLQNATLTTEEKLWLCEEAAEQHAARYDQLTTKRGLIRRYSLYDTFFQKNMKSYLAHNMVREIGAPPVGGTPAERMRVGKLLVEKRNEADELGWYGLEDELSAVKKARRADDGVFVPADKLNQKVDPRTTEAYIKRHNLVLGNLQHIDKSRFVSCACPLMSYVWFIICLAISGFLDACCKWNADACTFVFYAKGPANGKANKTVRLLHKHEYEFLEDGDVQLKDTQKGKSTSAKGQLPFAIKVLKY
jgi:hypothetical protein